MAAPLLGHLDRGFLELMTRVQADLRVMLGTSNRFTMPISGTGSAGMEAAVVNLVEPGDRVVVGVHGVFGERIAEVVRRQGGDVVAVRAEMGRPLDEDAMAAAIAAGPTKLVAFVHAETSTGVLQSTAGIVRAAREGGALVLADCVTSLGGTAVAMDEAGFDAVYSGTQKCLSVPPGLAPLSFSPAAVARVERRGRPPTSWYFDVGLLSQYWRDGGERSYHHTAPIAMIYALARGLDLALDEGLPARFSRHTRVAAAFARGLEVLGLENPVDPAHRLPMLTPVRLPDGIDEPRLRGFVRTEHRVEIGAGLGPWKGRIVRVGLMGHGASMSSVRAALRALAAGLLEQGVRRDVDAALAAAG